MWARFVYYVLETNKESFIKRVIGVAGDHVKIEDGKVYLNDELLEEPYLQPDVETRADHGEVFMDVIVPEGTVFLMGDNRSRSTDSRSFGCIPLEKIESTVAIRIWPLDKWGKVE